MRFNVAGMRATGLAVVISLVLAACAGRPTAVMTPIGLQSAGTSRVDMLVVATREKSSVRGEVYSGERGLSVSYADVAVSIPPDNVRTRGDVQWPARLPGDPSKEFVTLKADTIDTKQAARWVNSIGKGKKHVLVFVHGFNNRFEDAVYRFAQIQHDSGAATVPVLFTWPSRGSILAYGYDRESTNYSRDALEGLLRTLARDPSISEISILAHSMGNWLTLESLRQMAIRDGRVAPKIQNVMLAAPDVDVDVFRSQIEEMGKSRPNLTLFVSRDDRALAASRRVWGNVDRLGSIDASNTKYAAAIERYRINVVDLTNVESSGRTNHAKFANSEVVNLIGRRLASGQPISDSKAGIGERISNATVGVATTVGSAAGLVLSAPIAIVDPQSRSSYGKRMDNFGNILSDTANGVSQ